jgi:hypothetical protein
MSLTTKTVIKIMKKLLLALLLISPAALSEDTDVEIRCKVLDQVVMTLGDGKSTRYSGFQDGPEIGGAVSLSFSLAIQSLREDYKLVIKSSQHPSVNVFETVKKADLEQITDDSQIVYRRTDYFGNDLSLSLGGSYLHVEGSNNSSITGHRYYKSDWNFFVKSVVYGESQGDGSSFLQTLNCINVPSSYDRMLGKIISSHTGNK